MADYIPRINVPLSPVSLNILSPEKDGLEGWVKSARDNPTLRNDGDVNYIGGSGERDYVAFRQAVVLTADQIELANSYERVRLKLRHKYPRAANGLNVMLVGRSGNATVSQKSVGGGEYQDWSVITVDIPSAGIDAVEINVTVRFFNEFRNQDTLVMGVTGFELEFI